MFVVKQAFVHACASSAHALLLAHARTHTANARTHTHAHTGQTQTHAFDTHAQFCDALRPVGARHVHVLKRAVALLCFLPGVPLCDTVLHNQGVRVPMCSRANSVWIESFPFSPHSIFVRLSAKIEAFSRLFSGSQANPRVLNVRFSTVASIFRPVFHIC